MLISICYFSKLLFSSNFSLNSFAISGLVHIVNRLLFFVFSDSYSLTNPDKSQFCY